jgi:hypothetical protein
LAQHVAVAIELEEAEIDRKRASSTKRTTPRGALASMTR